MVIKKEHPLRYTLNNDQVYTVIKQFVSKKHPVYLVCNNQREQYVLKSSSAPRKEVNILRQLHERKVAVPRVVTVDKHCFLMEYIEGPTLCELLEKWESQELDVTDLQPVIDSLIGWLNQFYYSFGDARRIILGDPNLRNFICAQDHIFGLDFETLRQGSPEDDVGRMCAYILTYRPAFTQGKLDIVSYLLAQSVKTLDLEEDYVRRIIGDELDQVTYRRGQLIPEWFRELVDNP